MKKILLIIAIIIATTYIHADLLILKDGTEINGKIIKLENNSLIYHDQEKNINKTFNLSDLTRLDVFKEYSVPGVFLAKDIKENGVKDLLNKDYSSYSEYPYITIFSKYTIKLKKDNSADFHYHFLGEVFKAPGKSIGTFYILYIPGKSNYKIDYARSITNGKIVYANDYSVTDSSIYPSYPLYNKAKQVKVIIPKVETGSFVEYSYVIHYKKLDEIDNPFNLSLNCKTPYPQLEMSAIISTPKDMDTVYFEKNNNSNNITVTNSKNKVITYSMKNIAPYHIEDNIPPSFDVFSSFYFSKKYSYKSIAEKLNKKFKEKSNISKNFLKELRTIYSSKKTNKEKLEAIYNFITKQINTANVNFYYTYYYPLNPKKIYDKRLGSNLDKTFLCHLMLSDIGIKNDILFLHSRSNGILETKAPSIDQFSDIALMLDNGKMIYLGDSSMRLYSIPTSYQGSKALSLDKKALIDIPLFDRVETDKYDFYIDKSGTLNASVNSNYKGNLQNSLRNYIYYSKKELDQSWQKRVASIHPNASLISYSMTNLDDLCKDVSVKYSYSIKDFPKKAGDKMMAFKILDFYIFNPSHIAKKVRNYPIFYSGKYKNIYQYNITIPTGYKFAYFPKNISEKIDGMDFSASFSNKNPEVLNIKIVYSRNNMLFSKKEYNKYRKFIKNIIKLQEDWLIIEKI